MKVFSNELLNELATKARTSERKRAHQVLHSGPEDLVQRFFVTAVAGTYFRPHRHSARPELAIVLRGNVDVLTFDDRGIVLERMPFGDGSPNIGFETPRGVWHTLIVTAPSVTFIEVKQGPYDPATAAEFAVWAPAEGSPDAAAFAARLALAQSGSDAGQPMAPEGDPGGRGGCPASKD